MIYVLFDIDKTLLEVSQSLDDRSSAIMFKKVYKVDAYESMVETHGKTEYGIISEILEKIGKSQLKATDEAYNCWAESLERLLQSQKASVMPGISNLLPELKKIPETSINLLTGNSPYRAAVKLKSAGLYEYFYDLESKKLRGVFGDQSRNRAELLKTFKSQMKSGDKAIVVDDSLEGTRMSKAQNIPVISIATGKTPEQEFLPYNSNIFQDLGGDRWKQVIQIISSL